MEGMASLVCSTRRSGRGSCFGSFSSGVPIVLIDRHVPELETDYVVTDNEDVGYN